MSSTLTELFILLYLIIYVILYQQKINFKSPCPRNEKNIGFILFQKFILTKSNHIFIYIILYILTISSSKINKFIYTY
jgi:hypothetical protein